MRGHHESPLRTCRRPGTFSSAERQATLRDCSEEARHGQSSNIFFGASGNVHKQRNSGPPPGKPQIESCRSPNEETFTCWWLPKSDEKLMLNNYTVIYSIGDGEKQECPDYVTGGKNSCFFDSEHTEIWEMYCLTVTAWNQYGSEPSDDYCLDLIDVVEPDPPINISWQFLNTSQNESRKLVLVTWRPPMSADVGFGWITLQYQLQYKSKSDTFSREINGPLKETKFVLFDLKAGESYQTQVRCRPQYSGHWSSWSSWSEIITIPPGQTKEMNVSLGLIASFIILIVGLGAAVCLRKRIKSFMLPPIPKPKINGIDSCLLKKGRVDEINSLLNSFHGYTPPHYNEDSCEDFIEGSTDEVLASNYKTAKEFLEDRGGARCDMQTNTSDAENAIFSHLPIICDDYLANHNGGLLNKIDSELGQHLVIPPKKHSNSVVLKNNAQNTSVEDGICETLDQNVTTSQTANMDFYTIVTGSDMQLSLCRRFQGSTLPSQNEDSKAHSQPVTFCTTLDVDEATGYSEAVLCATKDAIDPQVSVQHCLDEEITNNGSPPMDANSLKSLEARDIEDKSFDCSDYKVVDFTNTHQSMILKSKSQQIPPAAKLDGDLYSSQLVTLYTGDCMTCNK
uniref:prolactin receptor-like n=1 Tax=Pristiophorus japonicus TaxID=55135 RepID=UPI00398EE4AA